MQASDRRKRWERRKERQDVVSNKNGSFTDQHTTRSLRMLSVRILVFTRTHAHKHTQIDMDLPRDSRTGVTKEEDKGIIECCVLFQDLVLWVFCVLFQDLVLWFLQVAQCSHISSQSFPSRFFSGSHGNQGNISDVPFDCISAFCQGVSGFEVRCCFWCEVELCVLV